ncbi:APC family permease [Thermofilum pendens]|uniref:Amino acid permease-associated region n=1 Tax=Thermofilum pendens (strain DSM 2475 / Hrk 5) TaxID=368408 RepID=A1S0D0_THEPD|nr:APC family permease [Thermofilum pendens]ABL78910.1 amino acid permease-associated region [Thermofilum pendens Hrk 5]
MAGEKGFRRSLTLLDAVSVGLGAIIGAGIFVLIGIAAGLAGPAVVLAVLVSGLSASLTALSFAELGSALPRAGGVYEYGHTLLHPAVGFLMGWMWVAGNIVLGATASQGFGYYLSALVPSVNPRVAALALVVLVTLLNALGAKLSAVVNDVFVAVKVSVLLLLVAAGAALVKPENFQPFAPKGLLPVMEASALFYFAYIGFPRISTLAEEVKDPEKNIPRAILLALAVSAALYALVAVVAVGVAGYEALASSNAPLEEVARRVGVGWVVGVGGLVATFSVVLTSVMGQSRVFYAMARNREIPDKIAEINEKLGTPVYSVLLSGTVMLVLVALFDISRLAMVTSFLVLVSHVLTNVADVKLYLDGVDPPFRSPLRPWHAVAGAFTSLLLSLSVEKTALAMGLAVIAAGALWFFAYTRAQHGGNA